MAQTRRSFIAATGAAALGAAPLVAPALAGAASAPKGGVSKRDIMGLFADLPGDVAVKIVAPPANGDNGLSISSGAATRRFVGSAIKTFVLCETLRQVDSPQVVETLSERALDLNASVWNGDSATLNPPNLIGQITHRTALEAMILHSDNTGTDMSIKAADIAKLRAFIASIGLDNTVVPDSTRAFFGYLLGAPNPRTFTWDDLLAAANSPVVNSPLNDVQTLASSADDLVSYYSRALRGDFFTHDETLAEFRRILNMADVIWLVPFPLGVTAFAKGGSVNVPGYHALCAPGGMFFDDRWVFFCFTLNWYAEATTDLATVGAWEDATAEALARVKGALERR